MEKSQKAMNDPANQAKMKKMQEQMNTPEMKAMMEKNPQMKASMEAAMKMLEGGGTSSFLPKSLIIECKSGNSLSKTEGGMMNSETLYLSDKKQAYIIDRNAKTWYPMTYNMERKRMDSIQRKVTKTGETMKVLDYTCTKYLVEMKDEKGNAFNQVIWTTTEIKGVDVSGFAHQKMGNTNSSFYYDGITGVPLRMEIMHPQMNMQMEVTSIKKESLPASDFIIPADFKETKSPYMK